MKGILNALNFINDNWATIIAIVGLIVAITGKTVQFFRLSKEQKKAFVTTQISNMVLHLVAEAENLYGSKTGEIKRSYVFDKIYTTFPELQNLISRDELERVVDDAIESALEKIKDILKKKTEVEAGEEAI